MVADAVRSPSERPALQLAPADGAFVGRELELAALEAAVDAGARRIWVSGASGLGKTEVLAQLAVRCREHGTPYYWVGPHEALTPTVLRTICDELARTPGASGRRLLILDDFAPLRAIESWFVERFLPALPAQLTVVIADRAATPAWRGADAHIALAPLGDADARRYLERRGVDDHCAQEILALAEGIPAILAAAADAVTSTLAAPDAAGPPIVLPPATRAITDGGTAVSGAGARAAFAPSGTTRAITDGGTAVSDAGARAAFAPSGTTRAISDGGTAVSDAGARAAFAPPAVAHAIAGCGASFYARHDTDAHRLAIAVLAAARTTPYELLELAFEEPVAARDAFAWLSRLSVVEHSPDGLRPHTLFRKACERELTQRAPAVWTRARNIARRFAERRIAIAREPQRWVLDRLFVDRELAAVRDHMILRAAEPAPRIDAAQPADRAAIFELAAHVGAAAAAAAARWLDDESAAFDVLRDACGGIGGYLCTIALDAGGRASHADPVLDTCAVHLRSIGWFEPSSAPDARALVFRDWTVAGTHQAPSCGTAQLIAHMAARLVTTPGVDHAFLVTDRPEPWQRALRALGLEPAVLVEPRLAGRGGTVIAADLRRVSVSTMLERLGEAAAARDDAPPGRSRAEALRAPPVAIAFPALVMPAMTSPVPLATSTLPALSEPPRPKTSAPPPMPAPAPRGADISPRSARKDAAPRRARGERSARTGRTDAVPRPVHAEATGPLARLDASASAPGSPPAPGAVEPEGTLEQRIARLARSAALSPREHEVLQLLLLGRNYAEIGTALQITPRTARFHQHNILEKIGAESRLDIVRLLL